MNVRHLLILTSLLSISGCSLLPKWGEDVKPITVKTEAVARTPLNLPDPAPLKMREVQWLVITPENAEQIWQKLKDEKKDLMLIALTDEGYEMLAMNIAEIKNLIAQQRSVIIKYKEYYEPPKDTPTK